MIYPSVTLLLDGLTRMIGESERELKFTGIDTSFSLSFKRDRKALVSISTKSKQIGRIPQSELADATLRAAQKLADSQLARLSERDAVRVDYLSALREFRALAEAISRRD